MSQSPIILAIYVDLRVGMIESADADRDRTVPSGVREGVRQEAKVYVARDYEISAGTSFSTKRNTASTCSRPILKRKFESFP